MGVEPKLRLTTGIKTFLGMETVHKWTPPNVWIGPDQKFFIGMLVYKKVEELSNHVPFLSPA